MQEPEPIDWEYYRRGIGSRLVDMYKEAYESMFLPNCLFESSIHFVCINPLFHILVVSTLQPFSVKMMFCKVKPHSSYASAFCFELKSLG